MKSKNPKKCEEPLCVFCLSAFFIRGGPSKEKSQAAPSGRQFPSLIPSRSGFQFERIYRTKLSANLLDTVADLFGHLKRRRSLTLGKILDIVKNVWKTPEISSVLGVDSDMEAACGKSSIQEPRSPIPQRRRLSVPETIMRKHNLATEQTAWHDAKHYQWDKEAECQSDPNLHKRKSTPIRKSTLLRRLWGDNSKSKLAGSFQEWQHSSRRLSSTQSLNSSHSSPERMRRRIDPSSPRRRFNSSPNKSLMLDVESPKRKTSKGSAATTTKYTCSSFTNVSESNSDSAFSNFTTTSDENSNGRFQESAVQTRDVTANLNVISNINLSQATLDIIYKEVMKDMANKQPRGTLNINSATVQKSSSNGEDESDVIIDKEPTFYLDLSSEASLISNLSKNCVISKVKTGSPYCKPSEPSPLGIPRYSAVPRTSSMEVNNSDEEREDSDKMSCVDSLDECSYTQPSRNSSSDVTRLLPEGRRMKRNMSSTFFIPIEVDREPRAKAVSELLPLKVRERLNERQQKREEKFKQFRREKSVNEIKSSLNWGVSHHMPKRKAKPLLPSIASLKKPTEEAYSSNRRSNNNQYHKQTGDGTQRIEILEILEYASVSEPNKKTEFDPRVDQLIANILIDSLNHDSNANNLPPESVNSRPREGVENNNFEKSLYNNRNINVKESNKTSYSQYPKEWVTVYTVHKDRPTPESTSDEGKKYLLTTGDKTTRNNKLYNSSTTNSESSTLCRNRSNNFQRKTNNENRRSRAEKHALGDWSVTISGSNNRHARIIPDVEMRLKFPKVDKKTSNQKEADSPNNRTNLVAKLKSGERLPKIESSNHVMEKREHLSMMVPRQTKTSTSRYHFSRLRDKYSLPDVPQMLNERQYLEIMKRIPDILAVTGRSISPERK